MAPSQNAALESQPPDVVNSLDLTIRCYDAVIKDLVQAKEYHLSQRTEATYDRIRHAQDIVTELLVSLDYDRGGVIAQNLSRIYNFVLRQLIGVNSSQDTAMYDHLVGILSDLKGAWEQVRSTTDAQIG